MDEYVIIICMLGGRKCGGKYNNMREDALEDATDPREREKEKKIEREVVNMYVKSGGLTDGGRRKRRRT